MQLKQLLETVRAESGGEGPERGAQPAKPGAGAGRGGGGGDGKRGGQGKKASPAPPGGAKDGGGAGELSHWGWFGCPFYRAHLWALWGDSRRRSEEVQKSR